MSSAISETKPLVKNVIYPMGLKTVLEISKNTGTFTFSASSWVAFNPVVTLEQPCLVNQ